MGTKKITSLLAIGQLALDLHTANNAANSAKREYQEKCNEFERNVRTLPHGHIDKWDPRNWDFIDFTLIEYNAYQKARHAAYNIKRRLGNACRRS